MRRYTFELRGRGRFPVEALWRYDAYPVRQLDARQIGSSLVGKHGGAEVSIRLRTYQREPVADPRYLRFWTLENVQSKEV